MSTSTQTIPVQEFQTLPFEWTWRNVLRLAALAELGLLLLTMVALRDLLAAALAVILLVGFTLFLLRGKFFGFVIETIMHLVMWRIQGERIGALILAFLFADIGFYTLTGAASNLLNGGNGAAILLPASLGAFSLIGFVAAVICVIRPGASVVPSRAAVNFTVGVLVVWLVVMGIGLMSGTALAGHAARPSDVHLVTENMGYSQADLSANAGVVVVELENHDLFWHTFTIPELDVDMKVPMQATQQIAFEAPPGTYTFHCTIPGHDMLGMTGTLTVK